MPALSALLGNAAPDGLRRPRVAVELGGPAADWAEHLVACEVTLGLLPHVGLARLTVAPGGPRPALGDTGTVALGYEDAGPEPVLGGAVWSVRDEVRGTFEVVLANAAHLLATMRMNQSFEQGTAGDVVSALAGEADVATGTVEAGVDLPFYALDDRRSALDHVAALAARCGFLAYFDEDDALQYGPPADTPAVQSFHYGGDILGLALLDGPPALGSMTFVGDGAAGSQGDDAWSWLVKDPGAVTGSAGAGAPARARRDGGLRTGDAAQAAADGAVGLGALIATTGELLVAGAPLARVGAVIELADTPGGALDGTGIVTGVTHRLDKCAGFVSRIRFARSGSGSGFGGLAGALP